MDILKMVYKALERKEFVNFLRGDGEYMIEMSQYAPDAEVTDVGKVLSKGIYKAFKQQNSIKIEFERSLITMLDGTDFDIYMVCLYLTSQLFKEKNELSPFVMDKQDILKKLSKEINRRNTDIMNGITYPSGYTNVKAWDELERFNAVCKEEYNISLF